MIHKTQLLFLLICILLSFSACGKDLDGNHVSSIEAGIYSKYAGNRKLFFIARSKQEFEKLYELIHVEKKESLPKIDFMNEAAFLFFLGREETASYSIGFKNAIFHQGVLEVTLILNRPTLIQNSAIPLSPYLLFSFNTQNVSKLIAKDEEGKILYERTFL